MSIYTDLMNKFKTRQTSPLFGQAQVANNAGGYVYQVSPMEQLRRFLIIGTSGGSFYVAERKLTEDNAKAIIELIKADGMAVLKETVAISVLGRAIKNDPAIFVMALLATYGNELVKTNTYDAISQVCRTGTHLFHFTEMVNQMRGWSAGLRRGVSKFYLRRNVDNLAVQLLKYRQRDGWTHRDVLRLCHASTKDEAMNGLFRYTVGKEVADKHPLVVLFESLQKEADVKKVVEGIKSNSSISWEMLPTAMLKEKSVYAALLPNMGLTALLRNLSKLGTMGLLDHNLSETTKVVVSKIADRDELKKQKVHPFQLLLALNMYTKGEAMRGDGKWKVNDNVKCALNDAFYASFENVVPTGKNFLLGLDISVSMGTPIANSPISCAEATGALAMLYMRTEPNVEVMGFGKTFVNLGLSKTDSLEVVMSKITGKNFGNTDCSLPMLYALEHKLPVDVFMVMTDNETYAGKVHPSVALQGFRQAMNKPDAKLIVMGMVANEFSIADKADVKGQIDIVGMDANVPVMVSEFIKGF
jgi:60 kDa SS-A/Ro ribonucleoprotein